MKLVALLMLAADLNGQPLPDIVLLDFTSESCGPCRQMAPIIDSLERRKFPIHKVDFAAEPALYKRFQVSRIPTFIVVVQGKEAQRFVGLTSEDTLSGAVQAAANQLSAARQKQEPAPERPVADNRGAEIVADSDEPPGGIRGFFNRMRDGLGNEDEDPQTRGQSPDSVGADNSPEMRATVRIRVLDGRMRDFATGTIIHSVTGQSTIVTCSHAFRTISNDAVVEAELFDEGKSLRYPAQLLGTDHETDVAFLRIQNKNPLPFIPVAERLDLKKNQPLFSNGCNAGNRPTRLNMNVVEVNGVGGLQNIYCTNPPVQGRSGGGLFNTDGRLVGVCSGILNQSNQGLYSGVRAIRRLGGRLNLPFLQPVEDVPSRVAEAPTRAMPERAVADLVNENPFDGEDAMFAEMDAAEEAAFGTESPNIPIPTTVASREVSDPFATRTPVVATVATTPAANPEITVIINSDDPAKKRVVVIPNPSSWLLQLLTGEAE